MAQLSKTLAMFCLAAAIDHSLALETVVNNTFGGFDGYYHFRDPDAACAQAFTTKESPVPFHSVTLHPLTSIGASGEVEISIWSGEGDFPTELVETLGTTELTPSDDGFTFTSKRHPLLLPDTVYWIVVRQIAGDFRWGLKTSSTGTFTDIGRLRRTSPTSIDGGDTWIVQDEYTTFLRIKVEAAEVTVVENTNDSGPGSLRQAIAEAAIDGAVLFDAQLSGQTIRLTSGELLIDKNLIIDASNMQDGITITGDANENGQDDADSRIFKLASGTDVVLDNLTITEGYATDPTRSGGGIYAAGGSLIIRRCNIIDNHCVDGPADSNGGAGGGLSMLSGDLIIEQSTIANNTAGDGGPYFSTAAGTGGHGGGIHLLNTNLTLTNSTVSGNISGTGGDGDVDTEPEGFGGDGGGIYLNIGTCEVRNSTIVYNEAKPHGIGDGSFVGAAPGPGGAFFANATIMIANSVLADNIIPADGSAPNISRSSSPPIESEGVNFLSDNQGAFDFPEGQPNANGDLVGTAVAPLDPLLGPLADNGGPTLTHMPLMGSPLRDPEGGETNPLSAIDQRGFPRLGYDTVDIGSVEFTPIDQAAIDAAINAEIDAAINAEIASARAAAARAANQAQLQKIIKKFAKKLKLAKRKKQVAKVKRFSKKLSKTKRQLSAL